MASVSAKRMQGGVTNLKASKDHMNMLTVREQIKQERTRLTCRDISLAVDIANINRHVGERHRDCPVKLVFGRCRAERGVGLVDGPRSYRRERHAIGRHQRFRGDSGEMPER